MKLGKRLFFVVTLFITFTSSGFAKSQEPQLATDDIKKQTVTEQQIADVANELTNKIKAVKPASPKINTPTVNAPSVSVPSKPVAKAPQKVAVPKVQKPMVSKPSVAKPAPAKQPTTVEPAKQITNKDVASKKQNSPLSTQNITALAIKASLSAYTYDYKDYEASFNGTEQYFTKSGWMRFEDALYDSKNIDVVKQDKLRVSAELDGTAKLVKQEAVQGGGKIWHVIVPLKVSYKGEHHHIKQRLNVNVGIVPSKKKKEGIAVIQFVAQPA